MYMTLCDDYAVIELELSAGTDEFASRSSFKVAALPYGRRDAERPGVGKRQFYLRLPARRAENADADNGLFRADDSEALFAGELPGLAQIFFLCEGSAFSEEDRDVLFCQMDVSCRRFN